MNDPVATTEPFVDGLSFGECPRWHDGRLWYADFYRRTVSSVGPSGDVRIEVEVPGEPAGLGWLPDGRLLVVARKPRTVLRLEADGQLVEHGDLRPMATFHGNDMVVDSEGRAYVGNFGFDLDRFIVDAGPAALFAPPGPPTASLVRVDPDGSVRVAAEGLAFPNGTVITPDGGTLIIAETLAGRLSAFDSVDRRLADRPAGVGPTDRLCARRNLPRRPTAGSGWPMPSAAECILVSEGGAIIDRVATTQHCFACMLGDPDRRTLYVMTARTSTESEVSPPGRPWWSEPGSRCREPGCPEAGRRRRVV